MDVIFAWIDANKEWFFGILASLLTALGSGAFWLFKTRRERQRRSTDHPFIVLKPESDLLAVTMPDPLDSPLNDRNILYKERQPRRNVRREMEDLLREQRALLVCGKSGLGKTREASHLAKTLNQEGWTVLYLSPDAWLEAPARRLKDVPDHKLLLFLDDLSRRCYSGSEERNPREDSPVQPLNIPFQQRLLYTLNAFEKFYGKDELLILATTRDETEPAYEGQLAEWNKLEWNHYSTLWERFVRYNLPEPDSKVSAAFLTELGEMTNVRVENAETLARRNDGTFRNLKENLAMAANPGREEINKVLNKDNFRDTSTGTWKEKYRRAIKRYPEAKALYTAANFLRRYQFPLERHAVLPLAQDLVVKTDWWDTFGWWAKFIRLPRALRYLERCENFFYPRDGQMEAAPEIRGNEERLHQRLAKLKGYSDAALWNRLGNVYYSEMGKHQEAILAYQKAIALDQKAPYPWNGLGNVYKDIGKYEEAIQAYQKAIALDEKFASPWSGLGVVYRYMGKYEEAIQAYQKAIALDEKASNRWSGLGNVYRAIRKREEAIQAYQKAIALDEKSPYPWTGLGNVYDQMGKHEEAIQAYQKSISLDEKYASPWNGLGNVYSGMGKHEEAVQAYQKAITLGDEKDAYPWSGLGSVYRDMGKWDDAIQALQKAIELPNSVGTPANAHAVAWGILGSTYYKMGKRDETIQACQKAIALDEKFAYPWNGLGNVYRNMGKRDEAIEAYQKSIALDEKDAYPWYGLGKAYTLQGNLTKALNAYQRAVELKPESGTSRSSLIGILRRLNREAEAQAEIEYARPLIEKETEYNRICFAVICGETEEALHLLEVALQKSQAPKDWARQDPDFESIREHPKFKELTS